MEQTVFDLLESQFGMELGPELLASVEASSHEQLNELQERAAAFGNAASVPSKASGELRPYIPLERDDFAMAPHGMYLRPGDFTDPRKTAIAINAVKHHLLYCHSLAIDNPLRLILDAFIVKPAPYMDGYVGRARKKLANYLRFLIEIRPLLDAQVLVFVEPQLKLPFVQKGLLEDTAAVAESADFSDLPEFDPTPTFGDELLHHSLVSHANLQLARGLVTSATHSGSLDLYLPYRHYEDVLRAVIREEEQTAPTLSHQMELRLLSGVLNVKLPALRDLRIEDLVAVRRDSEAFARWRAQLERALERVERMDEGILDADREALRLIERELLEGRQALEGELRKSSFLSQLKQGLKELSIGSIVAAALIPIANPVAALAGAAGHSLLTLLVGTASGNSDRETSRALHRQYLLFSPTTPDSRTT